MRRQRGRGHRRAGKKKNHSRKELRKLRLRKADREQKNHESLIKEIKERNAIE